MELNKAEEKILAGEYGEGMRLAMEVLVAVGRAMNATGLIDITSAHISGVNYYNIGDAGLELISDISKTARFSVKTTINPCGPSISSDADILFNKHDVEKQKEIYEAFRRMGAVGGCNCVPYEGTNAAGPGEHVSWAESNAVVFGNSVLGVYTNRESGLSALAAAVVGKTPLYGLHVEENRRPKAFVRLESALKGESEYGALGHYIGKKFKETVGIIGIRRATRLELKTLSASIGTYGSLGMFKLAEIPEKGAEVVDISKEELKESLSSISSDVKPDAVFIGCPFTTAEEITDILNSLNGKRPSIPVYIFTYSEAYEDISRKFNIKSLRENNVHLIRDTCPSLSKVPEIIGAKAVLTDSSKASFYLKASSGVRVAVMDRESVISKALSA